MVSQRHRFERVRFDPDGLLLDFRCEVEGEHSDRPVLLVAGEVDLATADRFRSALFGLVNRDEPPRELVVDLAQVTYFAAVGITALEAGDELATARGVQLQLRALSAPVWRVLEATGSRGLFRYVPDDQGAWPSPR